MGRQKEIPGTERPKVQEVEDAADAYVKSRNKRQRASKAEKQDKDALINVMRKNKLTVYAIPDEGLVVTLSEGKADVKVTAQDLGGDDDEDDGASHTKEDPVN